VIAPLLAALLLGATGAGRPIALTVSGGVSLGAYQAGYLYYSLAAQRVNPGMSQVIIATGASAGSVNALLALRTSCAAAGLDPEQSLFHRVWVPMGLRQLHQRDERSPIAAFSQRSFTEVGRMVEEELALGLPTGCDVVLGVATSRLAPRLLEAAEGRLRAPVTEEHFVIRIRGQGPGRMPLLTNFVDPDSVDEQALLPERPDGSIPFDRLLDAVIASTSFPAAFPPRAVRHCVVKTRGRSAPFCPEESAQSALFVDGGVFDNSPLRLAATFAGSGLVRVPGKDLAWRDAPDLSASHAPPSDVAFAFVSADAEAFPNESAAPAGTDGSLLPMLAHQVGGFVDSARSRELVLLIQDYPATAEGLLYPRRHVPAASSPMYAFFGFFDRGFRAYDFALGMYEARKQLAESTRPALPAPVRERFTWPEDTPEARAASVSWASFACLRAVFEDAPDAAARCTGDDQERTRILARVSVDRLWDRCRPDGEWHPPPAEFRACARAREGGPPPPVAGIAATPDWRREPGESEATQVTRLLAAYGYAWTDIDVPAGAPPEIALAALRAELSGVAEHLARSQPTFGEKVAVGAAGKLAVNLFYYVPPRRIAWITLGRSLEIGMDWAVTELSWLRLTGALAVQNLLASFGSNASPIAFTPLVGLDAVPRGIGSAALQPSFLARGGWVLAPADDFGGSPCEGSDRLTPGGCTRPALEAGAAVAVTGILRVQLMASWYPPARGAPGLWSLNPSLGFQIGF
jgi:hypothetical protein